jgi:hypothetical protein
MPSSQQTNGGAPMPLGDFTYDEAVAAMEASVGLIDDEVTDLDQIFGEAGTFLYGAAKAAGDNPVPFLMGIMVGVKLAEARRDG